MTLGGPDSQSGPSVAASVLVSSAILCAAYTATPGLRNDALGDRLHSIQ